MLAHVHLDRRAVSFSRLADGEGGRIRVQRSLGAQGQRLGAGIWIGIGMAFAWVALID